MLLKGTKSNEIIQINYFKIYLISNVTVAVKEIEIFTHKLHRILSVDQHYFIHSNKLRDKSDYKQ